MNPVKIVAVTGFFALIFLFCVLLIHASNLFNEMVANFNVETAGQNYKAGNNGMSGLNGTNTTASGKIDIENSSSADLGNRNGKYETIEETIARIKRDVVATGTIVDSSGTQAALFRIEGMEEKKFLLNSQLMDGFVITEITNHHVVLKNQTGEEKLSLPIRSSVTNSDGTRILPNRLAYKDTDLVNSDYLQNLIVEPADQQVEIPN